jgi:TonB family protein
MNWWQYLLLVNLYLVLFYGFYALLLRRETFFQLNRIYLVSAALLSFFIPLIQAGWVQNLFITQKVAYTLYSDQIIIKCLKPVEEAPLNFGQLFAGIYLTGVAFWVVKLIVQLITLNKIIKNPGEGASWSFFKKIKLDENANGSNIIDTHERVHAKQWHSADVLIVEAVMIINWFNPVVYFYRRAIKHIHEFIADSHAIATADSKTDYALLLMSQTFSIPQHQLLNHFFNNSLLKQRIIMLQKNKSQRIALLKYGLSAPLFILMLVLSSATVNNSKAVKIINKKAEQVFATPAVINVVLTPPVKAVSGKTIFAVQVNNQPKQAVNIPIQKDSVPANEPIFTSVEQEPQFIGGQEKLMEFLANNIKYPADMREHNIQGKVIVSFIVEKNGSVSNVKALHGPGYGAEDEAERVISLTSSKWIPGLQNHQYVRVQYVLPISFALEGQPQMVTLLPAAPDTGKKITNGIYLAHVPGVEPLYILDGKEIKANDFKTLNPNDIESIDILKDKAAILLYGSDAKNGVVIIKLKKRTQ